MNGCRRVPRQKSEGQPRKSKRHALDGGKKLSKAQSTSNIPQATGQESPAEAFRRRRQQQKEYVVHLVFGVIVCTVTL